MNFLTSPIAVRLFIFVGAFLLLICLVGLAYAAVRLRRGLADEDEISASRPALSPDGLAFATFQQTIAELKSRERELELKMRAEIDRANSAEAANRSLLENLPIAVILFNRVGLVKQANPAACRLLGYASPVGLSVSNLLDTFSFDIPDIAESPSVPVAEVVQDAFRDGGPFQNVRVSRASRSGSTSVLEMTVLPQNGGGLVLLSPVAIDRACTKEVLPRTETPSSNSDKPE